MKAIDEDDIDTSTADGTFIFNLKVSLAQREIGKTSERIKFVFQNKREKGEVTSGTKKYGYDIVNKKYQINQSESQNIVNLYDYFIKVNGNVKETYEYFIQHFNGKGQDALYSYLRDTAYIGKYKLYRKDVYIENYTPKIMDDELFYSVQNLLKKGENKSSRTKVPSIFAGIIQCNVCKNRMCRKQDSRSSILKMRYICDNASRRKPGSMEYKCTNHKSIKEEEIEDFLLNNVKKVAQNYITKNEIVQQPEIKDNSKEIKQIERKINKLKDLYLDDLINKITYKTDYEKLNKKLKELKTNTEIPQKKDFSELKKLINLDITKIYKTLSNEEKRTFWLNIVDKIYVENGEIKEITFL